LDQNLEGAKFWLRVMNELKNRGVEDIRIAVVDGLKGFPEAINAVFLQTTQTCLRRASHPKLDGFCVVERPQGHRRRVEENLSGERHRR
jgi:putative transposase